MGRASYSPSTPTGSVFCHLTGCYLYQLCPFIMEKILVLLLVTLAVAYAVPDPRGIIVHLVRGSSGEESFGPQDGKLLSSDVCTWGCRRAGR